MHGTRQHLRSGVLVEAAAVIPRTGGLRGGLDIESNVLVAQTEVQYRAAS